MINGVGIHIKVKNFKLSEKFYNNLGFKKVFEYGPNKKVKEKYSGIVYAHNNCKLEIADDHVAVKSQVFQEQVSSSKISLMIYVDSLKYIIDKCKKHNISIAVPPKHFYWGTLELVLKDPDGVVLVFITKYTKYKAKQLNLAS